MVTRVVVLGAGFGGLELATVVSEQCGDQVDLTLIDKSDGFVFGFSKLDVMFGRLKAEQVVHPYADLVKPGVRFVTATVTAIDAVNREVETDGGTFAADILVVALGADLDPQATPGFAEDACEFYSVAGAFAAREVLSQFQGGRVVVGVSGTPFKCPPAPSETALLMHEFLTARGLRDNSEISLVMPLPVPIPPSPDASAAILRAFDDRGISFYPGRRVSSLDPDRHVAQLTDGSELPYDLYLGIPVHRAPQVVEASGLTIDGWIPVDRLTLETTVPGVYAIGDVTSVGTPKAGVFAEGQAVVAAARIVATIKGRPTSAEYDGRGICYLEFGADEVGKVDVSFLAGQTPAGALEGPSTDLMADKKAFGSSRIRRWFDREWRLD